jgi:hypothetical protein
MRSGAAGQITGRLLAAPWGCVLVPACAVLVYHSWLRERTLFYDDWMYFEERADAPNWIRWALSPMQEHFTPIAKSIFVLDNLLFGYRGAAYTAVSLVLYLGLILTICRFLCAISLARATVLLVAFTLGTAAVYSETVIWSHDKLVLFLLGLVGALGFFFRAERKSSGQTRTAPLVGLGCCLLLSMASLGLGIFTLVLFALFAIVLRPWALLSRDMLCAIALPALAFGVAYLVFAHQGVSSDVAVRVGGSLSPRAILEAARASLFTFVFGSLLPLFHVHRRPAETLFASRAAVAALAGALFFAVVLSLLLTRRADRADRASSPLAGNRTALLVFALALIAITSMSQNLYRAHGTYAGLGFVLEWNRYAFLPATGLILGLAAVWDATLRLAPTRLRQAGLVTAAAALAMMLPASVAEVNAYQTYFLRNARVKEIQAAFEPMFRADVREQITGARLPDVVIKEPTFVRPLRLSTYARFHRPPLRKVSFLSPSEMDRLTPAEREAVRGLIRRTPALQSLYTNDSVASQLAGGYR